MTDTQQIAHATKSAAIRRARNRDRVSNIFSATIAETPSFDDVELWTLIEGAPIEGKPRSEASNVANAKREYDSGLDALAKGLTPLIANVPVKALQSGLDAFAEACTVAARVASGGAPVHSVINALNLTLVAFGDLPVHVHRAAAEAVRQSILLAQRGSVDELEKTLKRLRK